MGVRPPKREPKHPFYSRKRHLAMVHVDQFIMDCLLPTTDRDHKMLNTVAYELYQTYCRHTGCKDIGKIEFGRSMSRRFMRCQVDGYPYYLCELRPNLLEE